jgi:predicted flavoprotein YhiN
VSLVRETTANKLPNDPSGLAELLKGLRITINAMAPIDRAISSAGGIALSEIDAGYMITRQPGVFVAGEMLDWEAPTGGYLLQACFSTGAAAANGVLTWLGGESPH